MDHPPVAALPLTDRPRRRSRSPALAAAFAAIGSSIAGAPSARGDEPKPTVAVFPIDLAAAGVEKKPSGLSEALSSLVGSALVRSGRFFVAPPDQLRSRAVELKAQSYKTCFDQSCQVELGKAVAAAKIVSGKVVRIGSSCRVVLDLFDLRAERSEGSGQGRAACTPEGIEQALDGAISELVASGRPAAAEAPKARPAEPKAVEAVKAAVQTTPPPPPAPAIRLPAGSPAAELFTAHGLLSLTGTRIEGVIKGPAIESSAIRPRALKASPSVPRPPWIEKGSGPVLNNLKPTGATQGVAASSAFGDPAFRLVVAETRALLEVYKAMPSQDRTHSIDSKLKLGESVDESSTASAMVIERAPGGPRIASHWVDRDGAIWARAEMITAGTEIKAAAGWEILFRPAELAALPPDKAACARWRRASSTIAGSVASMREAFGAADDESTITLAEHLDGLLIVQTSRASSSSAGGSEEWEALYDLDALLAVGVCRGVP